MCRLNAVAVRTAVRLCVVYKAPIEVAPGVGAALRPASVRSSLRHHQRAWPRRQGDIFRFFSLRIVVRQVFKYLQMQWFSSTFSMISACISSDQGMEHGKAGQQLA